MRYGFKTAMTRDDALGILAMARSDATLRAQVWDEHLAQCGVCQPDRAACVPGGSARGAASDARLEIGRVARMIALRWP